MSSNTSEPNKSLLEAELIVSAKGGDDYAFELLAQSYKRVLDYYVKRLSPTPSIYEDLFQEGLIGLFKAVRTYDSKTASFATYASHCVRNSIISGIRKYANQNPVAADDAFYEEGTVPSAEEVHLDGVRAGMLYDKVCTALSPYEKTVFDMYLSDISYENIAFVTGKSVKSTTNAVYRIREKLKQIVVSDGDSKTK